MKARDNPFRVERLHRLEYEFDQFEMDWPSLLRRLHDMQWRGAILGPHGVGKTTLMLQLQRQIEEIDHQTSYLRLNEEDLPDQKTRLESWLNASNPSQILLLDSAGLMNFWNWTWFRRQTQNYSGLIITCHKSGRLPTAMECQTSPELLQALVSRLTPEQNCSDLVDAAKLHTLFRTHQGNIRDCLRALYDEFATR